MPVFAYRSTDMNGLVSEGMIEAADEKAAMERLRNSGAIPLKITTARQTFGKKIRFGSKRDLLTFTTQLASLLGAGLSLDGSLHILSELTESRAMTAVIQSVMKSVREGNSLSDALAKYPNVFSKLYINMIRAGEAGGVLDVVLEELNGFLETSQETKDHIFSAMIYPIILVVTGGLSIALLLTFVLPRFAVIFNDLGGSVPVTTRLLLSVSQGLQTYWWIGLLTAVTGMLGFRAYVRSEAGRYRWDALKLKLIGDLIRRIDTARFCRTLGTLLKSGVPLLQGLNNAKDIIGNRIIAAAVDHGAKSVKQGKGLAASLGESGALPPLAISMIKVGEETGQLDRMLIKVASAYEKSTKEAVKRFVGLLEPALILIMGIVIGFIVVSMMVAVFSMVDLPM